MKLLLIALLALPSYGQILSPILFGKSAVGGGGGVCTPASGYSHCRQLTIDHTQVPSTQTNFPVALVGTLGSSRIQNSSCYDVIITSDSAGATKIPWEIESCNQSTGAVVMWFLVASLSSSVDTKVYVHYDDASISTAQNTSSNGPTHVWDSNFKAVWHLPNGSSLSGADSSGNSSTLSTISGTVTAATGELDGGASITSTGTYAGALAGFSSTQSSVSASGWINMDSSYSSGSYGNPFSNTSNFLVIEINSLLQATFTVNGVIQQTANTAMTKSNWYFVAGTYDGTNINIYINGSLDNEGGPNQGTGNVATFSTIQFGGNNFIGLVDEFRVSNIARSADWITAEYNNQKTSSTFLTVGSEI